MIHRQRWRVHWSMPWRGLESNTGCAVCGGCCALARRCITHTHTHTHTHTLHTPRTHHTPHTRIQTWYDRKDAPRSVSVEPPSMSATFRSSQKPFSASSTDNRNGFVRTSSTGSRASTNSNTHTASSASTSAKPNMLGPIKTGRNL